MYTYVLKKMRIIKRSLDLAFKRSLVSVESSFCNVIGAEARLQRVKELVNIGKKCKL